MRWTTTHSPPTGTGPERLPSSTLPSTLRISGATVSACAGSRAGPTANEQRTNSRISEIEIAEILWPELLQIRLELVGGEPWTFALLRIAVDRVAALGFFIRLGKQRFVGEDRRIHAQRDGDAVRRPGVDHLHRAIDLDVQLGK